MKPPITHKFPRRGGIINRYSAPLAVTPVIVCCAAATPTNKLATINNALILLGTHRNATPRAIVQTSNLNSEIRNNQKMGQRPTAETRTESYPNIEDKANLTTIGCREPGIQVARPLKTTDDLFDSRSSPRTESLVAAAVQWAERIMRKMIRHVHRLRDP